METSYKSDPVDDIGKSFWTEIDTKLPKSFTPQSPQFAGTFAKETTTVIDPEDNGKLSKPISQLSSQLMGPPPKDLRRPETEHCKVMVAKLPEVCAQPKILLEKLCFDTSRNSTSGAIKLSDILDSHREFGLENGELKRRSDEGASEYGEVVCLKRKSPASVTNKKKPYRSVARSEQIASEKSASKSFDTSSCSQNVIERSQEEARLSVDKTNGEEQKMKEYALHQPRSYTNQANKDTLDHVPELYSNRTTHDVHHASRFSVKNAEFRAAVNNNSSNNDQDVGLHDKAQYSCPRSRHATPSGYFNVVSDVPSSNSGDETEPEQNLNRNRSLKLTFSRIHNTSPLQSDGVGRQSNSVIKTSVTVPGSDKRGLMVARLMPARSLTKLQRCQFVRKSRKPCLKQRFVRTDSTERLHIKGEREPCDAKPQLNGGKLYADQLADDQVRRLPPKKLRLSPENDTFSLNEPASGHVLDRAKMASDGLNSPYDQRSHAEGHSVSRQREMPKTLDEFRDIVDKPRPAASFVFKAKPREVASKTDNVCRSMSDAISDWDAAASGVSASKDDDRITSTGNYSNAEVHPAIANKRENIFEKFRSPIEAQEVVASGTTEGSKLIGRSREAKTVDRQQQTVQEPERETAPAAVSCKDPKDIKELFGDCDSDSTECCKYEDLDQFFDNSAANGAQMGGLVGRSGSFYQGFSPFNLPSDSDDNLIVDESVDVQPVGMEENGEATRKKTGGGPELEQETDEDHQLKKLRCTAYRNYARMQRKGGGGGVQKSRDRNPAPEAAASISLLEDTTFKLPEGPVCRKRKVNSPKKTTMNTIKAKKRKKMALGSSSKSVAAAPAKRATASAEEEDKDDSGESPPCSQKPIRLSKKFITRSKARTRRLDGGKPVKYGRRKGTAATAAAAAAKTRRPTVADDSVPTSVEDPEIRPGVDGISAPASVAARPRKKGATRGKVKTANEAGTIKKQGKPGKTKAAVVKDGSESEASSEPPKIDILSRELGPRYNWLEQKIQAMQRSSSTDETSELVKSHVQKILSAVGTEKHQTTVRRSASDEEKRRGPARTKRPNQASSRSSGAPSQVASGDPLTTTTMAAEKQNTGEDIDVSSYRDIRIGFAHNPSSAGVDLRGALQPMGTLEAARARPSSAESAPSALEIPPPEHRICDLGYGATAVSARHAPSGTDPLEFETRSEPSCLPVSKSVAAAVSSYKRTPRFRRNYALLAEEPGAAAAAADVRSNNPGASLERSLSLTNLDPESDQSGNPAKDSRGCGRYGDVLLEPYLDCPLPFDLRLPTARCYPGSSDNDLLLPVEMSSSSSPSKGGSTHMLPLQLTISPRGRSDSNDDLASRRASLDSTSAAMERQSTRIQNDANDLIALGGSAIVIDLTAESEAAPGPAAQDPGVSKEGGRPDPRPGPNATPILSSIKHEYERRLEMYERLNKVSKIKDQEIAILESERKRVKSELEYLKNIFLKATSDHAQTTDFGGPIPNDLPVPVRPFKDAYDLRKVTEAHNRESTVSLLASQMPPEANSAKTDLSMYTYLKCRYERERSALSMTEPPENETNVPGLLRNLPEAELSSAQVVPTSSASVTFRQPVRSVAQRDPGNLPNHCGGSNEPAWNGSDSSPVQTAQSHFEIPPLINDRTSLKADARTLEPYRKEPEQDLYLNHEQLKLLGQPPPGNSFSTAQQLQLQQQSKADSASRDLPQVRQRSADGSRERCGVSSVQRNEYLPTVDQPNALAVSRDTVSDDRMRETGSFGQQTTQCEAVDLSGGRNSRQTEKERSTYLPSTDIPPNPSDTLHRLTDNNDSAMMSLDRPPPPVAEYASVETPLALNLKSVSRADDSLYPGNRARTDPGSDAPRIQKPASDCFLDLYESGNNRTKANPTELDEGLGGRGSKLVIQIDEARKGLTEDGSGSVNYQKSLYRLRGEREKKLVESEGDRSSMTQSSSPIEGFRRTTPNEQIPVSNPGRLPPTSSGAVNSIEIDAGHSVVRQSVAEIPPQEQRVSRGGKATEVSVVAPSAPYPGVPVSGPGNKGEAPGPAAKRWTKPQMDLMPPYADKDGISSNLQDMSVMVNSIAQDSFPRKNNANKIVGNKSSPDVALSEKQQRTTTTTTTMQSDVLMTTSPGYTRNLIQRRPADRMEQRQGPYPAPESQPQMALYRRDIVHGCPEYPNPVPEAMALVEQRKRDVEAMRLQARGPDGHVFDGPGGVHSLQRYNELHQAMNHQARQPPQQQHFGSPVPAGLSPRDPAFVPPSMMRSEVAAAAVAAASSRVSGGVQQGIISPNDLGRFGKQQPPPESLHFTRIVGPGAVPHPPPQLPVPRPAEGHPQQQRPLANVPLQAEVNQGQQVTRKESFPITGYQKGGLPPETHLRQHGFHLDQPAVPRHPYHRDSGGPPPDYTRNPYVGIAAPPPPPPRVIPEMQRDGVAVLGRPDENLLMAAAQQGPGQGPRNDAVMAGRVLRQDVQGKLPKPPADKGGEFYESNAAVGHPGIEHRGYASMGPGGDPSGPLVWRVNKPDSNPVMVRGGHPPPQDERRMVDYHVRHLDQRPLMQPVVVDPTKGPPSAAGVRDAMRFQQQPPGASVVGDCYLPAYMESPSVPSQPYRSQNAMIHSSQLHLPRQPDPSKAPHVLPRHPDQMGMQLPPPPPPPGIYNDTMRLIPHNHQLFYPPPAGILPPEFISGNGAPGVLLAERIHVRPGFEQHCSSESYAPNPYTVGDRGAHMGGTSVRVGPTMAVPLTAAPQPPPIPGTSSRQRQQRQEDVQPHGPGGGGGGMTRQAKVPPSQDAYKVPQQQMNPSSASQMGKPGDYICDVCRKQAMFVCSACRGIAYCSTDCQAISWQTKHSAVCRQL